MFQLQFVLRRQLTLLQFVGAFLIVVSIGVAKTPDLIGILYPVDDATVHANLLNQTSDGVVTPTTAVNAIPITAIALALVASCNSGNIYVNSIWQMYAKGNPFSVGAAVYTEQLFKSGNVGESFLDQQFWLYSYGSLVAFLVHLISNPAYFVPELAQDLQAVSQQVGLFLCVAILFASLGGIVVASILKYLDNIVKEYTGSVANILTAVASR